MTVPCLSVSFPRFTNLLFLDSCGLLLIFSCVDGLAKIKKSSLNTRRNPEVKEKNLCELEQCNFN